MIRGTVRRVFNATSNWLTFDQALERNKTCRTNLLLLLVVVVVVGVAVVVVVVCVVVGNLQLLFDGSF